MYYCGTPTRHEKVKFRVTLNREGALKHAESLRALGFDVLLQLQEGDTGHGDYTVSIDYFDDVVKKLGLVQSLLSDPLLVTEVDFEELNHGRSIIVDLAQKLTQIQDMLAMKRFLDGTLGGAPAPDPLPEPEPAPEPPPSPARRRFWERWW
jgi:hypothetical protein